MRGSDLINLEERRLRSTSIVSFGEQDRGMTDQDRIDLRMTRTVDDFPHVENMSEIPQAGMRISLQILQHCQTEVIT